MRNRFLIIAAAAVALVSCAQKDNIYDRRYYREDFFRLFYSLDGESKEFGLMPTVGASETFSVPAFGFFEAGDEVLASLSFDWQDNLTMELCSKHPYFIDKYTYHFGPSSTLSFHGWTMQSGSYSLVFDTIYFTPSPYTSYGSFVLFFEGTAVNAAGQSATVSDGRLIFMRNIVSQMNADDFKYYIYKR